MPAFFGVKQTHPTDWHAYRQPAPFACPCASPRGAITHSIIHDDKKEVGDATRLLFAPGPVTVQFNFEKKFHDEIVAVLLFLLLLLFSHCWVTKQKREAQISYSDCVQRSSDRAKKTTHSIFERSPHASGTSNWQLTNWSSAHHPPPPPFSLPSPL